jgi:hypothetical protein
MKVGDLVKPIENHTTKDFGVVINIVIDHMTGLSYLDVLWEEKFVRLPEASWEKVKSADR